MAVRQVDGFQVLSLCSDPICQSIRLRLRHEGIHQHGVPPAMDEVDAIA